MFRSPCHLLTTSVFHVGSQVQQSSLSASSHDSLQSCSSPSPVGQEQFLTQVSKSPKHSMSSWYSGKSPPPWGLLLAKHKKTMMMAIRTRNSREVILYDVFKLFSPC